MTIIVVLGGGLVQDAGVWRTSGFNDRDDFGVLGDRLRVLAGAFLFTDAHKVGKDARIIVCGGKGQMFQTMPDAPTVASVIKEELTGLGVPRECVIVEEASRNTYEQLVGAQKLLQEKSGGELVFITNRYHVPRVRAFVEYGPRLSFLKQLVSGKKVSFISAEEVVLSRRPSIFQTDIDAAYETTAMQERVALEQRGVRDIEGGIYRYTL
ncbi:MAG: YdcF family protein [bacterium]|nr:YdcF family protein [bacterium]